ncbi:MAG: Gfo/Idh/MocA family oxidoreductase [Phycisphaerae bacterium]|nr:Gfo/Idh/MocA family oxidoreductase [Phycisphaerae bacterium]
MSEKSELLIGVIGCGGRGSLAGHAHLPEENVRLVAAADINDQALDNFKEKYGPDVFLTKDYRELVSREDINAVFVTSPDFLHEEHALAAIEAGKAVYLEKPMAITIEGCDKILAAAMEHNVKLYLGHNMRHFNMVLTMKKLIDDGEIGEVKVGWCRHFVSYGGDAYFKDWHADRTKSTGLLLQKGAHDIDVLHWLCGGYTQTVTAMGELTLYDRISDRHDVSENGNASFVKSNWPPLSQKGLNPVVDVEDVSMMLMKLDNGVLASYQQCHYTPDSWRNYTIIGTEGRIENFGSSMGKEACVRLWNTRGDTYRVDGDKTFPIISGAGGHGGSDTDIVAEFIRFVREGGKINTSPVAARNSVAAGVMATESLRNGSTPMEIPKLPDDILEYFNKDAE